MSELFFEDVKVGDEVWDSMVLKYLKVTKVGNDDFKTTNTGDIKKTGQYISDYGQRFFWYPPVIEKQERPKSKIAKSGYFNIFASSSGYETRDRAEAVGIIYPDYIKTVKIEWETEE